MKLLQAEGEILFRNDGGSCKTLLGKNLEVLLLWAYWYPSLSISPNKKILQPLNMDLKQQGFCIWMCNSP